MFDSYILSIFKQLFTPCISAILLNNAAHPLLILKNKILSDLPSILKIVKLSTLLRLSTLVELTVCDNPSNVNRFTLNLFLLSIEYNFRLAINCMFSLTQFIPTLSSVYLNSNWSEREIRDMFGVYFTNNIDLRRLLTDYGFEGFPLRKDFPLTGYFEVRYDDERQQILYEPVQLTQEFRIFALSSP